MESCLISPMLALKYKSSAIHFPKKVLKKVRQRQEKKPQHQNQPFEVFKTRKPCLIMNDESSLIYSEIHLISNLIAGQEIPVRVIDS